MMAAHLYIVAGRNYEPLYVGQTTDPIRRFNEHRRTAHWWRQRTWHGVSRGMSLDDAARDEGWLINTLRPQANTQTPASAGQTCANDLTHQLLAAYRHVARTLTPLRREPSTAEFIASVTAERADIYERLALSKTCEAS